MNKKEELESFYNNNPKWEERRYELVKQLCLFKLENKKEDLAEKDLTEIIKNVDNILGRLNKEIEFYTRPFYFRVQFKNSNKNTKDPIYQPITTFSFSNPPEKWDIKWGYEHHLNINLDLEKMNIEDFEFTIIDNSFKKH